MNLDKLEDIQIAKPCKVRWNSMTGDERKRFCGACKLSVYNISEMTRDDAMRMIRESEGRVCLRMYRRFDGTILTKDCPVGMRADRRKKIGLFTAAAVLLGFTVRASIRPDSAASSTISVTRSAAWVAIKQSCFDKPKDFLGHRLGISTWCSCGPTPVLMGDICVAPSPTTPTPPAPPP